MGKIFKKNNEIVVELEIQKILTASVSIDINGKSHSIPISYLVNKLAWNLVKEKAPKLIKETIDVTKIDFDNKSNMIIIRYQNKDTIMNVTDE